MSNFWKNKRVFVTGHTGFKGSWLALLLKKMGAEVYGYSLEARTQPNLFNAGNIKEILISEYGDIRDYEKLHQAISVFKPEIIFHMAAQPLVRPSYEDPISTYSTNVMGTVNLLDIAHKTKSVRAVVNITTDKCYENKEWMWGYREIDPMGGHDPYSASKGCAELVTTSFVKSFYQSANIGLASARAGNVIGGGDWSADRLLPDILQDISRGVTANIRNPNATRPWQHVLEPLSGYIQLAMKLYERPAKYNGGWNFGPYDVDCKNVGWIADTVCSMWGDGARWKTEQIDGPHEAQYLKLDISKATSLLSWTPKWNVATAISKTVDWYKSYIDGNNVQELMSLQIEEYWNDN